MQNIVFLYPVQKEICRFSQVFELLLNAYLLIFNKLKFENSQMLQESTVEILQKLSKKEFLKLGSFARSHLNSVEILLKMYEEVAAVYPEFNSEELSYENMWKKLYPRKSFNDKMIRNIYTKFSKLVQNFIAYEEIEADEREIELNTIEALNKRKCYALSKKITESSKKKILEKSEIGRERFYRLFRLNEQFFYQLDYIRHETTSDYHRAIEECSEEFIAYALSVIFELGTQYNILKKNYRVEHGETLLDRFLTSVDTENIFDFLEEKNHSYYNNIKIRQLIYNYSNKQITLEEYYELKKILFENADKFDEGETLSFFSNIEDMLMLQLMTKNLALTNEILEMGKKVCDMNIFRPGTKLEMGGYTFRNYFTAAIMQKEFDWADNYIDKYIHYIKPEARENEYNYSKAIVSFKLNKYEESLEFINKFNTTDIIEKVNIRLYSLMNYIELGAHEAALSMISAIRQFTLESKEIPPARMESIQNSLKFFSEIVKSIANEKKLDYAILAEAHDTPKFFHRQYVIEKMETMV